MHRHVQEACHLPSSLMLGSVLQRNRTNRMHGEKEGNIYFKALAHAIVGDDKSEICRAGQQYGNLSKS